LPDEEYETPAEVSKAVSDMSRVRGFISLGTLPRDRAVAKKSHPLVGGEERSGFLV